MKSEFRNEDMHFVLDWFWWLWSWLVVILVLVVVVKYGKSLWW